jgi:UDP-N-acetylglucosamine--N-acetylmuramyl-(pentapeptide) pyrophosphoryl-undecaprenol N-acetylglucosamine transferase
MKIIFTGGGSGGHFYPIIAVAEEINNLAKENKIIGLQMYYFSTTPYNEGLLFENNITFKQISTGKLRVYFSILNFFDLFKTFFGVIKAIWEVFKIYPDVVFSKGGYASFPTVFAARFLRIPVILHESDSVPGRVNAWTGKFAKKIAVSYLESAEYFPKDRISHTGNPVRKEIMTPLVVGAEEFLNLDSKIPTVFVLGGSQGAQIINDLIIDSLAILLPKYQIIHQTGKANFEVVKETARVVLLDNKYKERYKPFDYLNVLATRMSAGIASLVISRAGSTIFEIALWGKPSIIIPITNSNGDHQRINAYSYARAGACEVIEEKNMTPNILAREIDRILTNESVRNSMIESTKNFSYKDSARKIAVEILNILVEHSK